MIATIILAVIIFGFAGYVIWSRYLKKDRKPACDACHETGCPLVAAKDEKQHEMKMNMNMK